MKLRVRGNSIRLRLSQTDLATLLEAGAVEDGVAFPSGQLLRYRLESGAELAATAQFNDRTILVRFPAQAIRRWARPDEVTLRAEQPLGDRESLTLLVEKDFKCLSTSEGEDDAELFPNPGA